MKSQADCYRALLDGKTLVSEKENIKDRILHYLFGCERFIYAIHSHPEYQRGECPFCDKKYVLKHNKWELQWWLK